MSELPYTKKALGQHWLKDPVSLQAICTAAEVKAGDAVLEIGPGGGTLTATLLDMGANVTALEYDARLLVGLKSRFHATPATQLRIVEGDIRSFDLSALQSPYKIVANIPYYLTANLLRKLVDDSNKPSQASLLVQKEVAERVVTGPGSLSFISIAVQLFYEASLGALVPARLFTPPPKVDSQVLVLKLRDAPLFKDLNVSLFFGLVKAGFSAPRKKLRSSLSGGLGISKDAAEAMLKSGKIDPNARAQELDIAQWHTLYQNSK